MRMDQLARPAIDVVHDGRVKIHPETQSRRYVEWLENIRPWCISRQLWWGHQIPVWYRGEETYVGTTPPEGEGWERDPDVLDTWFSSALWPFATLGWPRDTPELGAFYPTDVMVTARDILFLWVARMVMMGLRFTGEIPFTDVYVHSIIQAPDGRRMSKSLGTGIDPLDLIDGGPRPPVFQQGGTFPSYGADAMRFGLLAMSSTQDVRFSEEKIAQGAQLATKLWNASRFVLTNVGQTSSGLVGARVGEGVEAAARPATVEDRWLLSRLQRAKAAMRRSIEAFEFHHAALGLYDFVFSELCDRYIELVKPRLGERDVQATLLLILRETLALAHPVIPFVTEEIWSHVPGNQDPPTLPAAARWPEVDEALVDAAAEEAVERQFAAVRAVRAWRDEVRVPPGPRLPARLEAEGYDELADGIALLARLEWSPNGGEAVAAVPIPGGAVAVLASEAVDPEADRRRRGETRKT